MSIIPDPQLWSVDPEHLRALRRRHAETAFAEADFDRALAEAEELLSATPDDAEALWITARSALQIGDACLADAALQQLMALPESRRPVTDAQLVGHLSLAVFLQADFETAADLARRALASDDTSAMAWLHLALSVERLGQDEAARAAYAKATQLAPGGIPAQGDDPSPAAWAKLYTSATLHLSEDEQAVLAPLEVAWEWHPNADLLRSVAPPISPFIEALVSGDPPDPAPTVEDPEADLMQLLPRAKKLTLFRGNLLRGAPDAEELIARMVLSLRSEIAAWIGVPLEDLTEPE